MISGFRSGALDSWDLGHLLPLMQRYRDDILLFNRARNLVSRALDNDAVERLLLEGVAAGVALPLEESDRILDLGSGAGIPGVPIALVHPATDVGLLERRVGRCDFLRREVAALGLTRVAVLEGDARVWAADTEQAGRYRYVCLKAVAKPAAALKLARPFLCPNGHAVLFQRSDERADIALQHELTGWAPAGTLPLTDPATNAPIAALTLFEAV
jgi:16S rRNA (guanine527-N7)-methyltransferase